MDDEQRLLMPQPPPRLSRKERATAVAQDRQLMPPAPPSLRSTCQGLRTLASAEQPNRREATSSLRWVLLDFLRSCFFVPLSPFVIASISLWYPDMTFGRGHTEDNDECVFYVQRAIWWRSNGICPSPTTFYNRIDAPRRARSS